MQRRFFIRQATLFGLALTSSKILASCATRENETTTAESTHTTDSSAGSLGDLTELNFGIISTESQMNQRPAWEPFLAAFSDAIGMPVNASYVTEYAAVVEAMRFGHVQVAWYGGKSYIEAARLAEAEAFAQTVDLEGSQGYFAHLIMNANHPRLGEAKEMGGDKFVLENAADLVFAFNEPNSTSGFLVPSYYIFTQNDFNPDDQFQQVIFAGSHEATALAIANNQVDVATNRDIALSRLEVTNPEARAQIEPIWTSVEIPNDPIAYRRDLPEDLKQRIQEFFYTYNDTDVLTPLQWSGFIPASDTTWNTIRELDYAKQRMDIETDPTLSETERQQQLNEIDAQLEALQS